MKGFFLMIFFVVTAICHVHGLYSHKCKKAETSPDKVIRMIENANCTITEGKQRIHERLNNLHDRFKQGFEHFKSKFSTNKTASKYEGLDHQIDVRMFNEDNEPAVTDRNKREIENDDDNKGNF
jgi:hypothetical protein